MHAPKEKICFLLLPGFAPDNYPVSAMRDKLIQLGYNAVAANFWGIDPVSDFSTLTVERCKEGIANAVAELSQQYEIVIGLGISLGGALLMEHAKSFDNLDYIISIGTPFELRNKKLISFGFIMYPLAHIYWKIVDYLKLRPTPIPAAKAMVDYLMHDFTENLEAIQTPLLLFHSKYDLVTDVAALPLYLEKIKSRYKKIIYFKKMGHTMDDNDQVILEEVDAFLQHDKHI